MLREFYPAPGFCSERIFLFLATDLETVASGARAKDHDEEIDLVHASPSAILEGEIMVAGKPARVADAKTLVAAALVSRLIERGNGALERRSRGS
jgi:ADP-ribose pyrophosphatase